VPEKQSHTKIVDRQNKAKEVRVNNNQKEMQQLAGLKRTQTPCFIRNDIGVKVEQMKEVQHMKEEANNIKFLPELKSTTGSEMKRVVKSIKVENCKKVVFKNVLKTKRKTSIPFVSSKCRYRDF
jgi:hypothetical protein